MRICNGIILLVLLAVFTLSCDKPGHLKSRTNFTYNGTIPAYLSDSLPLANLEALELSTVTGASVKLPNGLHASYFDYEADKESVLALLNVIPFDKYSSVADTLTRSISVADVQHLREPLNTNLPVEVTSFWTAAATFENDYEAFDCIKPPFRHTLLVHKLHKRILHRVEVLG